MVHSFPEGLTTYLEQVRTDTRTNVRLTLSTVIHTRLNASLFYLHNIYTSTLAGFSYSGNQVGVELNYRF
jgi:hypothetical protein